MISKIKNIASIGRSLDSLNRKVGSYEEDVARLSSAIGSASEEVVSLKKDFAEISSLNHEFMKSFREEMEQIRSTREQFGKAVYDFSVLKKDMQKEIFRKFDTKLQEEFANQSKELKGSIEKFNQLRETVHSNKTVFDQLTDEISKLANIANGVKKADFEFSNFARQLKKSHDEKLALQRKIDSLERLVSRLRRK